MCVAYNVYMMDKGQDRIVQGIKASFYGNRIVSLVYKNSFTIVEGSVGGGAS